ncbi:hypothetical protein ACFX11_008015 [Malus domestica]
MVALRLMDTNIGDGFCTSVELDVPCANAGQDKPCLDRCTSKFPGSNGNKVQSQCGYVPGQGQDKPCLDRCTSKFPGSNGNKDQS